MPARTTPGVSRVIVPDLGLTARSVITVSSVNSYKPGGLLWDKCEHNSLRCDGVLSGAILFADMIFHRKLMYKSKIATDAPKNKSGLIHLIMMGKSICHKWVNSLIVRTINQ